MFLFAVLLVLFGVVEGREVRCIARKGFCLPHIDGAVRMGAGVSLSLGHCRTRAYTIYVLIMAM